MDETKIQNSFNKVKDEIHYLRIMGLCLGIALIVSLVGIVGIILLSKGGII